MTGIYGVVGYPAAHSLSPAMFKAAFWEYNMDDTYEKFEVHPDHLADFIEEVKKKPISGLSVTIPHKVNIIKHLDSLGPHAQALGAVNTVVNKNGKLRGYNTDWIGAKRAIEGVLDLNVEDKNVVVLGAGGAAAGVVYACKKMGANVTILNRTIERAQAMAEKFECKAGVLEDLMHYRAHLLVHTTSVGMGQDFRNSLVPPEYFKRGMFVFDIVYTPLENKLVKQAKRADCRIIPGYKMLLYQGEKQFELWFKKKPRTGKMEQALLAELR